MQPIDPRYGMPSPAPPPTRGVPVIVWICIAGTVFILGLAVSFGIGIAVGARAGARSAQGADPSSDSRTTPALPAPRRDVPTHDVTILDGCSGADLDLIESRIGQAIELGAPTYNRGDFQGCFSTYERTARDLESRLPTACKAAAQVRASDKAWAMRDAFDGMLDVIDRAR